jgi:hypothetical protein
MKKNFAIAVILILSGLCGCQPNISKDSGGWQMLFNGKDLTGWKASEKPGCFTVERGTIKVHNGRSHLFYVGPVENAVFKNFHFSAKVKTTAGSNSGIYFHTAYQQTGWPQKGYECQVNLTGSDKKKSGGLYDARDTFEQHANDNQWYTQEIIVRDKHIVTKIDGKVIADYTEPKDVNIANMPGRKLSSGTFAIQGHDPKSVVYYKDIKAKPL